MGDCKVFSPQLSKISKMACISAGVIFDFGSRPLNRLARSAASGNSWRAVADFCFRSESSDRTSAISDSRSESWRSTSSRSARSVASCDRSSRASSRSLLVPRVLDSKSLARSVSTSLILVVLLSSNSEYCCFMRSCCCLSNSTSLLLRPGIFPAVPLPQGFEMVCYQ